MKIYNKNSIENFSQNDNPDNLNLVCGGFDVYDSVLQANVSKTAIVDLNNNQQNNNDIYQHKKFTKEVMLGYLIKKNNELKGEIEVLNAELILLKSKIEN